MSVSLSVKIPRVRGRPSVRQFADPSIQKNNNASLPSITLPAAFASKSPISFVDQRIPAPRSAIDETEQGVRNRPGHAWDLQRDMIRAPVLLRLCAGSPVLADLLVDHFGGVAVHLDGPGQVLTRHGGYLEILRQRVANAPCRLMVRVYDDIQVVSQRLDLDNVVLLPFRGLVLAVVDIVKIGVHISRARFWEYILDWGGGRRERRKKKEIREERAG